MPEQKSSALETATFGAGCFWGVEDLLGKVKGVKETAVGYMGGTLDHPTYEDVCTDKTGHAEVVQLKYDPSQVSYDELLEAFWDLHNPMLVNRQGPDVGTQYRSVIFYHTPEQKAAAQRSKEKLDRSGNYPKPAATEIAAAPAFWRAEEYHQKYFVKHPGAACHV